jgi:mono/diheme cytochrome c family protein
MAHSTENNLPTTKDPRAPRLGPLPFWLIGAAVVATVASWVPLVFFARARVTKSPEPPVLLMQDMQVQPKYSQQQSSEVFADGRAMRPRVEGTVARGMLDEDDHYFRGWTKGVADGKPAPKFFENFPAQVKVDEKLVKRGQERFGIYCSACHGLDGSGNGAVHARAVELQQGTWVQPSNLADEQRRLRPVGHIFNSISVGIRNMPGYAGQIPVADRWAIVAYVRALQLSQNAPEDLVPPEKRK